MSGFFAPGRSRTFMQFLSIDSEIFPLLAVVATTFGVAGYVAGAKVDSHFSKLVHLTPSGHPWSNEAEATQPEYKYKFYRHADPAQQSMPAPSAMVEHVRTVQAPKNQIPSQMLA